MLRRTLALPQRPLRQEPAVASSVLAALKNIETMCTNIGRNSMNDRICRTKLFLCLAAAMVLALAPSAFAQFSSPGGGADDSNGVFQLEGDAKTTGFICFGTGPLGPVIATPGAGNS